MLISPFTPLFFNAGKSDGIESRYCQTFATTDKILVEIFNAATDKIYICAESKQYPMQLQSFKINSETTLYFAEISGLTPGFYKVYAHPYMSKMFRVTDDNNELADTTLIQYSMKDNLRRTDARFVIDGMRYFFDFRVPGGFKDSQWTFGIDNEQFVTADADPIELYATESTQKKFTIGWQEGVPVMFAELLNRLLTCTYVYFDGERYARKDSSVPEMSVQIEGLDSFVFTQLLQKVNNLNPTIENANRLIMRRSDNSNFRATDINENSVTNRIIR